MNKQKYKVGDRVRVVKDFGSGIDPFHRKGKLATILDFFNDPDYPFIVRVDGEFVNILVNEVEHVKKKHPVIVITTDGKTTTATMHEGKKVIKAATAKCSEKDTFDFAEGARIAFERLQGREPFQKEKKPERPEKLVCIKEGCGGYFKPGKVYGVKWRTGSEVFDFGDGDGLWFAGRYHDGRYIAPSSFGNAEFIPLVED